MAIAADTVSLKIIYEEMMLMELSMMMMMTKQLLLKNIPNSRLECKTHTLFMTKKAKIDTLFMDKLKRLKTTPVEAAHTYIAHIREHPPPPGS